MASRQLNVDVGKWGTTNVQRNTIYTMSDYGDENEEETSYHRRSSTESEKTPFYDDEKGMAVIHTTEANVTETLVKSISHNDHKHHKFYKPAANRTPVLVVFLLVIASCIFLLELAIDTYPDARSIPKLQKRAIQEDAKVGWLRDEDIRDWYSKRQQDAATRTSDVTTSTSISEPDSITSSSITSTPTPGQPNPEEQLTDTDTASVTGAPNPNNQISITTTNGGGAADDTTISAPASPAPDDQITVTSPTAVGSPAPDDQLTVTSAITVGSPAPGSQVTVTEPGKITAIDASIIDGSLIASGTSVIGTLNTIPAAVTTATLTNSKGQPTATIASTEGVVTLTNSKGIATATMSSSGSALLGAATLTDASGRPTATISFTGNVVLTNSNGVATATVSYTAAAKATTAADGSANRSFTQFDYFLAMYLPNIIGVVLQAGWLIVYATFKLMEPFYQLASHNGASAGTTLTADYLSAGMSFSFAKAALENHWVLLLAGLVQFCLSMVVLLDSGSMNVVPTAYCKTEISDAQPCAGKWVVNSQMIRVMEVFLVGCFSMLTTIILLNRRRVSGVYSDPSKIATMADVLIHKPLIQELRDIPPSATKTEIEMDLQDSRYMLGTYITEDGQQQYGIIKMCTPSQQPFTKELWLVSAWRRFALGQEKLFENVATSLPFLPDFICMSLIITMFSIILVYYLIPGVNVYKSSFNVFMSSGTYGPKIVLSGLGIGVSFFIKHKERDCRLSHPYVLMSKGPQPASECITTGTQATQFTSLFKSIKTGDISLALLSVAAIFADIILILTPGIPQTAAQTRPVYLSSTFCCLGLLGIIFLVQVRVTFKQWQRGHNIEAPDTLAAVLMRLCASQFVEEKNTIEASHLVPEFGEDDRHKQRARYEGKNAERRYRFGPMEGVDGVQRYMVDEDAWLRRRR